MIRKICPVCEQTMSLPHYCKNCRKFVKTPYVRDITYYLNESHPAGEKDPGVDGRRRRQAKGRAGTDAHSHGGKIAGQRRVWYVILGIFVLVQLMGGIGKLAAKLYVQADFDKENGFELLSDEAVQKEGIACNSNGHYSISGPRMEEEMEGIIEDAGYDISFVEHSSWNYADREGEEPWTNYEISTHYYVNPQGSGEKDLEWGLDSVTVGYDTVTKQLHEVSFYMTKTDRGAYMARRIVEFLQKQGEIGEDKEYGKLVESQILWCSDRGEDEEGAGNWMDVPHKGEGQTEVYFHETDGTVYVRIWKER